MVVFYTKQGGLTLPCSVFLCLLKAGLQAGQCSVLTLSPEGTNYMGRSGNFLRPVTCDWWSRFVSPNPDHHAALLQKLSEWLLRREVGQATGRSCCVPLGADRAVRLRSACQ